MAKINIQNLPKDRSFQECIHAEQGHKLVYLDFDSVEPTITAHYTQDEGLLSVYGPNAKKPNCIYLRVGAGISLYKDDILKWYDPDNPTPEGVQNAKLHAAKTRQAVKPAYLGWQYGLGPRTLSSQTGLPMAECKQILEDINNTFKKVPEFNNHLKKEWRSNGGWEKVIWEDDIDGNPKAKLEAGAPGYIINGRGRPLAIAPGKSKDCGSRFIQSTGHDLLLRYVYFINNLRKERGVNMRPAHVDLHDATIWMVTEEDTARCVEVFEDAKVMLNDLLNWDIKLTGDVKVGDNLGDFLE